jgi:hypothetical protein
VDAGARRAEGWQALGNGAELERETKDGRTRLRMVGHAADLDLSLRLSRPESSASSRRSATGRTFRMFHRETDAAR